MRISDWSSDVCSSDLAVAADDEVAVEPLRRAVLDEGQIRAAALEAVRRDIGRLVDDHAAEGVARRVEIVGHLGLAVDQAGLAAGEALQVDAQAVLLGGDVHATVDLALAVHSSGALGPDRKSVV